MRDNDASGARAGLGPGLAGRTVPPPVAPLRHGSPALRRMPRAVPSAVAARPGLAGAMWASLVPLMLLLHPYAGLVQDARIYVGRGVADRDPAGVGRDVMFLNDGQTAFSLMRKLVDASLSVMGPASTSMVLTFLGSMAWLAAAIVVARSLSRGRAAWAAVVCMVALPTSFGAFGIFNYAEAIATPRLFAQAAVLAGLAASAAGRRGPGVALLALGLAIHPLVALPGVAVEAVLLARRDRRWLVAAAAAGLAVLGAASVGVPVAARLLQPMDGVWLSILRNRSTYLFPTLWPADAYGPVLCQATAVIVAAALSRAGVRALLLAVSGVAAAGLATSWLLGDVLVGTLVVQLQPWRALWLLAVFGNAALALSVLALWRRGTDARLILLPLLMAWIWPNNLPAVAALSALTLAWLAASLRGAVPRASRAMVRAFAGIAVSVVLLDAAMKASVGLALLQSARAGAGAVVWPMVVGLRIQAAPLCALAFALAVAPLDRWPIRRRAAVGAGAVVALACCALSAAWLWDGRTAEQRIAEATVGDPGLAAALGPGSGEVMWIDEDSESWFLLHRPSFLNTAQAGPMLFSRALALEWSERAALARSLGWARPSDVSPWTVPERRLDPIVLRPDALARFCADPRRPAAVVVPGDQRAGAPPDWTATLWRPAEPFRRAWIGDGAIRWARWDVFTVVRCPAAAGTVEGGARSGDARSLG